MHEIRELHPLIKVIGIVLFISIVVSIVTIVAKEDKSLTWLSSQITFGSLATLVTLYTSQSVLTALAKKQAEDKGKEDVLEERFVAIEREIEDKFKYLHDKYEDNSKSISTNKSAIDSLREVAKTHIARASADEMKESWKMIKSIKEEITSDIIKELNNKSNGNP